MKAITFTKMKNQFPTYPNPEISSMVTGYNLAVEKHNAKHPDKMAKEIEELKKRVSKIENGG